MFILVILVIFEHSNETVRVRLMRRHIDWRVINQSVL